MKTLKVVFILAILVGLASGLLTQSGTPVQADHVDDLVASWLFDEVTGSIADDDAHVATTLDGELSGGIQGNGLIFDGSGDYVEVGDAGTLDVAGDLTLEAWVKNIEDDDVLAAQFTTPNSTLVPPQVVGLRPGPGREELLLGSYLPPRTFGFTFRGFF